MDKIAIIVHRYGPEINGGSEEHARMLAERLKTLYDVDVLTSRALNFPVWDNHYPVGEERMNGVRVLRFTHEKVDLKASHRLGRYLRGNWKYFNTQYRLSNIITLSFRRFWYRKRKGHAQIFERWIENDGPVCKEMISFLQREKGYYKAFIFLPIFFIQPIRDFHWYLRRVFLFLQHTMSRIFILRAFVNYSLFRVLLCTILLQKRSWSNPPILKQKK